MMKPTLLPLCASLFAASALMALAPLPAMAESTQAGAICKPTGNSNRAGLRAGFQGVKNNTTADLEVICPVIRTRTPAGAYVVLVDILDMPATCTAYSFGQPDGGWRGQSATLAGTGTLTLTIDAGRVPSGSYQSVICSLSPQSTLFGIRPQQ